MRQDFIITNKDVSVKVTAGIMENIHASEYIATLRQFDNHEFGDIGEEDTETQTERMDAGDYGFIMGIYESNAGDVFWIIKNGNTITVLFPHEH